MISLQHYTSQWRCTRFYILNLSIVCPGMYWCIITVELLFPETEIVVCGCSKSLITITIYITRYKTNQTAVNNKQYVFFTLTRDSEMNLCIFDFLKRNHGLNESIKIQKFVSESMWMPYCLLYFKWSCTSSYLPRRTTIIITVVTGIFVRGLQSDRNFGWGSAGFHHALWGRVLVTTQVVSDV